MNRENVLALSRLSRIALSEEEAESLSHEFEGILNYVGEVKKVTGTLEESHGDRVIRNVFREDSHPHESGIYTEKILKEAPHTEGEYIQVKKIL